MCLDFTDLFLHIVYHVLIFRFSLAKVQVYSPCECTHPGWEPESIQKSLNYNSQEASSAGPRLNNTRRLLRGDFGGLQISQPEFTKLLNGCFFFKAAPTSHFTILMLNFAYILYFV